MPRRNCTVDKSDFGVRSVAACGIDPDLVIRMVACLAARIEQIPLNRVAVLVDISLFTER